MRETCQTDGWQKNAWAFGLIIFGWGMLSGIFDQIFTHLLRITEQIDIQQYDHPHFDRYVANEPIVGAILLVGGLILRYLPTKYERSSSGRDETSR